MVAQSVYRLTRQYDNKYRIRSEGSGLPSDVHAYDYRI